MANNEPIRTDAESVDDEISRIDKLKAVITIAYSAKDAKDKYSWKQGDHNLFCNMMDAQLGVLLEELEKRDKKFKDEVTGDVVKVMEDQWERVLKGKLGDLLDVKLKPISGDISKIKTHLERLERQQVEDEIEIAKLKIIHELPKGIGDRVARLEKYIPDVEKATMYRSVKWTIVRNVITALFAIGIALVLSFQLQHDKTDKIEKLLIEHIQAEKQR